jgi:uncharacterized protein with HEPN domain
MRHDGSLIVDMLRFARQAAQAGDPVTIEQLEGSPNLQATVLWPLTLLGEAASRVSAEYRDAHPHVPWRRIIGLRNVLIHDYSGVDFMAVHQVLRVHLPELIVALQALANDSGAD